MRLLLVDSLGRETVLPVRADIADELSRRLTEALPAIGPKRLGELSAQAILGTLVTAMEPDPRRPTTAQIRFALDISEKLGIPLPQRILQDRTVMGAFLTRHGGRFR